MMAGPPHARRSLGVAALLAAATLAGCLGAEDPEPVATGDEDLTPGVRDPEAPLPPVADFVWTPSSPVAGQSVQFMDRSTDTDAGIAARTWRFPDGTTREGDRVAHTFADAGTFEVALTVEDLDGLTSTVRKVVAVLGIGEEAPPADAPAAPRPHVVVAVVDTGINPYHEVFRLATPLGDPAHLLEGYPVDAQPLPLTLGGDYAASREADTAAWDAVEVGTLYWVPGTRIVGAISMGLDSFTNSAANEVPVLDEDGHGTATASRVAIAGPDVWVVMVETGAGSLDAAILWASSQPWIDVVSVSIGPLLNLPVGLFDSDIPTRHAWEGGKLVFAAAGNEPSLSATSQLSGPPWVVSVGGALPDSQGEPGSTAKAMDVVSDFSPEAAEHDSATAMAPHSGTSFSTPTAAGAVAQALFTLRAQAGYTQGITGNTLIGAGASAQGLLADGLTNQELRDAMAAVATYWDATSWTPGLGAPVLPAAPWVQMGWGYVGPGSAEAMAQALLGGALPTKDPGAEAYMASLMATRAAMWGSA